MGIVTDLTEVFYTECDSCGEKLDPVTSGPDLFGNYGFLVEWCEEEITEDIEKWLRIGGVRYEDREQVKLFCPDCKHSDEAKEAMKGSAS